MAASPESGDHGQDRYVYRHGHPKADEDDEDRCPHGFPLLVLLDPS